jgi:hypothetical protein
MSRANKIKPTVFLSMMFLVSRAVLVGIGVAAIAYLPTVQGDEYRHINAGPALDMWYRWDAGFYTATALYGYQWSTFREPRADMAFFPVYPLSIRGLNRIVGCSQVSCALVNGLLISNIALLASVYLLFEIVKNNITSAVAYRSVALLLISPISIFLSGCYTESLFLFLNLLTFQALRKNKFYISLITSSISCLTRPVGVSLFLPLLFYSWNQSGRRRIIQLILSFLPVVVLIAYVMYMGSVVGDWLAYFKVNSQLWGRSVASRPWEVFTAYFTNENVAWWGWTLSWIDLLFTLFYLFLSIVLLMKNLNTGLFALFMILIPVASGNLISMPRYGGIVFPLYWVISQWANHKWKQMLVYVIFFLLMSLFVVRFTTWHWIA